MRRVTTLAGSVLLALAAFGASAADNLAYSYIDLNYLNSDLENGPSGDGFGVRGSIEFAGSFFVFAEYASLDIDDFDLDQYAVGIGGHMEVTDVIDFTGRIGYIEADVSGPALRSVNGDGYLASLGLRGRVEDFELEGQAIHRDYSDAGEENALNLAARYFLTEQFAIGAEYELGDDIKSFIVGVRFMFSP